MKTKRNFFYLLCVLIYFACAISAGGVYANDTAALSDPQDFEIVREAETMPLRTSGGGSSWYWCLWSHGYVADDITLPESGTYEISIRMRGTPAEGIWAYAEVRIDETAEAVIPTVSTDYQVYTTTISIAEGEHRLAIAFINDRYLPAIKEDRNLYIDWVRVRRTDALPDAARVFDMSVSVEHSDQALLKWYTTKKATSTLEYGASADYGSSAGSTAINGFTHTATITGLNPETTYQARVNARDTSDNAVISAAQIFTTPSFDVLLQAETMPIHTSGGGSSWYWCLWSHGYVADDITLPESGTYEISIRMRGTPAEGIWAYAEVRIDETAEAVIPTVSTDYQVYTTTITISEGEHRLAIAFINDRYLPAIKEDRNLYIDWIRVRRTDEEPDAARVFDMSVSVEHSDQALLKWYTTKKATSTVEYGTSAQYGSSAGNDATSRFTHATKITDLYPETTYHARVNALDTSGNPVISEAQIFTMPSFDILLQAETMPIHTSGGGSSWYWCLWSHGYVADEVYFPATGLYSLTIRMRGTPAEEVWPNAEVRIDGHRETVLVAGENAFKEYETLVSINKGTHQIALAFTNDRYLPLIGQDRNLYIDWIRLIPMNVPPAPQLLPIIESEGSLVISWNDGAPNTDTVYYLERARDQAFTEDVHEFIVFDTTYFDRPADEGCYYYRIRGATAPVEDGGVLSEYSDIQAGVLIVSPSELTSFMHNGNVTLTWSDNSVLADGYTVYRREDPAHEFISVSNVPPDTAQCIDSAVVDGDMYEYVVCATWQDHESARSNSTRIHARVYTEFLVNTYTPDGQDNPSVARVADGGYVVCWESYEQDTDDTGIYGRVYDPQGIAYTDDLRLTSSFEDEKRNPKVAGLRSGGFAVVWEDVDSSEDEYAVCGRIFNSYGDPIVNDFRVSPRESGYQGAPSVAPAHDDGLFVVWVSEEDAVRNVYSVQLQKYSGTARPIGAPLRVDTADDADVWHVAIETLEDSTVVVSWDEYPASGDVYSQIKARRFDSDGNALGDAFTVNTTMRDTYGDPAIMGRPEIAGLREGGFVIAWETIDCDGDDRGISARVFDPAGEAVADDFQVNSASAYYQENHSVCRLNEGGFAIGWISYEATHDCDCFMLQSFSETGERIGIEYYLNDRLDEKTYRINTALSRLNDAMLIAVSDAADDYEYISDIYGRYEGSVPCVPVGPSKVYCVQQAEDCRISWEDNSSNEDGFIILRSEDRDGPFQEIARVPADTRECIDTDCIDNATYYYSLKSFNEVGESEESFIARIPIVPVQGFPEEPVSVLAGDILPYWNAYQVHSHDRMYAIPRMPTSYIGGAVDRSIDISNARTLSLLVYARESVGATIEIKKGATALIRETFFIDGAYEWQTITLPISEYGPFDAALEYVAFSNVSAEFYLAGLAFDVSDVNVSPPRSIQHFVFDGGVEFYWDVPNVPDVAGYHVYRLSCPGDETIDPAEFSFATARMSTEPFADTYHLDLTLENGRRYYFAFTTVDSYGNESMYSDIIQVIPPEMRLLSAPTLADPGEYSPSAADVSLSWTDTSAEGARFYELDIFKGNIPRVLISREKVYAPAHTVSLSDEGLYTFRVRALDDEEALGGTVSEWSNSVDYIISGSLPPNAPKITDPGTSSDTGTCTVSWSDESARGATLYYLEYSIDPTFSAGVLRSICYEPREMLSGLENGTYYFRVRAATERIEEGGLHSDYSEVVDITIARDTTRARTPSVYEWQSPTKEDRQWIRGWKEPNTAIHINGVEYVSASDADDWSAELALDQEGDNHFRITAVNALGNESDAFELSIIRNTLAPVMVSVSPVHGSEITRLPVAIHITLDEADAELFVDDMRISPLGDGEYMGWIDHLGPGENVFTVSASDSLGNTVSQDYRLQYAPYTPGPQYQLFCLVPDILPFEEDRPQVNNDVKIDFQLYNNGDPVSDESISFDLLSGSGTLSVVEANTDANGIASTVVTTGTDCDEPDVVRATLSEFLSISAEVHVFSQNAGLDRIEKLTAESTAYACGSSIDLRIRALDRYDNPVPESPFAVKVDSGFATLQSNTVRTTETGEASVLLQTDPTVEDTALVTFQSLSESTISAAYTIRTHVDPNAVTRADVEAKVADNAARIYDLQADITTTSTAAYLPAQASMRIWQKGELQKVEQYTPEKRVFVRPQPEPYTGPLPPEEVRQLHSFDAATNVYVIKTIDEGQSLPYPYSLEYVDYEKGVIIKTEYCEGNAVLESKWVIEYSDFILLDGCWVFRRTRESFYDAAGTLLSRTENHYTDIEINTGIPDSLFEE